MGSVLHHGLMLWSVTALATIGVVIFSRGFLLKRTIIEYNSTCTDTETSPLDPSRFDSCWLKRRFSRAVVLLVDGLRYDFVSCKPSRFHAGQFEYPCELSTSEPRKGRLYRFVADPPTTTLQRLQALTTGSLPTFVDASANFAAGAINEDNWVDQLHAAGRRIVFLGDDTWESLFPGRFHRSHPFPSFDVRDLDTVDDGILEHLLPELGANDWDVLVAHFLGVDHCGHRYGAEHPAMNQKLAQMNTMLRSVIKNIGNDTILLLMGDHGMTVLGDHGGDSADEVNSALFVYSSEGFSISDEVVKELHQIDLVPTLSLLLGIPIPAGNLGTATEELFSEPETSTGGSNLLARATALQLNCWQVHQYLYRYRERSKEFPDDEWNAILQLHAQTENLKREIQIGITEGSSTTDEKLLHIAKLYKRYLKRAANMCRDVWAKFDMRMMSLGIVNVVLTIAFSVYLKRERTSSYRYDMFLSIWITSSLLLVLLTVYLQWKVPFVVELLWNILLWASLKPSKFITSCFKLVYNSLSATSIIPILIALFHAGSFTSNSYVINEALVLNFLLQSLAWLCLLKCFHLAVSERATVSRGSANVPSVNTQVLLVPAICMFLFAFTSRLSLQFHRCREEQAGCQESVFIQPLSLSQVHDLSSGNFRFLLSVFSVVLIPSVLLYWLRKLGNLNGTSLGIVSVKYGYVIAVILICYYWALQALPSVMMKNIPAWQEVWVPRMAFIITGLTVAVFLIYPLFIYILPEANSYGVVQTGDYNAIIHTVYQHLKSNWKSQWSGVQKPSAPVVYGLATVYSSGMLILFAACCLFLVLLWGSQSAPAVTLIIVALFAILTLQALCKNLQVNEGIHSIDLSSLVIWSLMASFLFFATGHQPTLPAIQWHAAFVGSEKGMTTHWLPALKVLLNTAGSHVLFGLSFPLLLLWSHTMLAMKLFSKPKAEEAIQGEIAFFQDEVPFLRSLYESAISFSIFSAIKLLGVMVSAYIHQRHLMVWKIFAPNFMYEAILFIFSEVALLIGWMAVVYIHSRLNRWFTKLGFGNASNER